MIVYLDSSALVKRYVEEEGSSDVAEFIDRADICGTAIVSRVEVAAAIAKATRMRLFPREDGAAALEAFTVDWDALVRLQLTELLVARAADFAWWHGLRGYDATHLAAAHLWNEIMGQPVTVATYDWQLWDAAKVTGLTPWPPR